MSLTPTRQNYQQYIYDGSPIYVSMWNRFATLELADSFY